MPHTFGRLISPVGTQGIIAEQEELMVILIDPAQEGGVLSINTRPGGRLIYFAAGCGWRAIVGE